jgi:hypothetical protein
MPYRASQCPYSHTSGRHEALLVPVFLPPFEGMPEHSTGRYDRLRYTAGTGSGTWDCWIVYRHSTGVYGRLRYTPGTGRVVAFMGSGIQATFSLRTFHNAHTAGVGQQVADLCP